ncbi:ankyrin repeat-containing domain protein [Fimicolochytrium jonesii]|uniref:ankyrin repeat-containing domain protein n=1 Tax=Fimicolochytrium jonesii TaxID=1396493 RepID=UPI0022FE86D9|nr:ankyrin repeat-containing domain protein [Fimicolochytrium jonesii]KAI8818408.1 ankyrin repeat-containing domain protein [Fimicolochytrium jonesii]
MNECSGSGSASDGRGGVAAGLFISVMCWEQEFADNRLSAVRRRKPGKSSAGKQGKLSGKLSRQKRPTWSVTSLVGHVWGIVPTLDWSIPGSIRSHPPAGLTLHMFAKAVSSGDISAVRAILSSTGEIGLVDVAVNDKGDRPLHFAARAQRLDLIKCLIDEGSANPNLANAFGRRPLHEAIDSEECVEFLLQSGADPNGFKHGTWTPAMIASGKNLLPTLSLLVRHGALLTPANKDGWTALHIAAHHAATECLEYLLTCAPELSIAKSKCDRTPLHMAASTGFAAGLEMLLRNAKTFYEDTNVCDLKDAEGATVFHAAAVGGSLECIDMCVQNGCDVHATSKGGLGAAHYAAMVGRVEVLRHLCGSRMDATGGSAETVRKLVEHDTMEGFTPAHYAAREGHTGVIRQMFDPVPEGFGLNPTIQDFRGRTPLDIARAWKREDVIRYLEPLC